MQRSIVQQDLSRRLGALLPLVVGNGCLNGLLREYAAVNLHGRELEVRGDVCVPELGSLVHLLTDDHLGGQGAACNGRAAAEGLELGLLDDAVLANPDLELNHVAARGLPNECCADVLVGLVQPSYITRVVEVVVDCLMVKPDTSDCEDRPRSWGSLADSRGEGSQKRGRGTGQHHRWGRSKTARRRGVRRLLEHPAWDAGASRQA
mmetsp:Transcript_109796/g.354227  ORF Transcript_109796/g.354227 Transcript_109796/m.354227 type:complete len:206 (-) Transcript_109796:12-629(-)